jgi:transposase InsO family protein
MIELARQYGSYGYRRVAALLRDAGWQVSNGRVGRLWRREGLKVPPKQPRLWSGEDSRIRFRAEYRNRVRRYDFVHCRSDDGKPFGTSNILDEFSHECLAMRVKRKPNATDVIDALTDLFILRGPPAYVRSDNGPEFVAKAVRDWITAVGAKTAFIEPGSPWENGYVESFNARFRDELLNRELSYSLNRIADGVRSVWVIVRSAEEGIHISAKAFQHLSRNNVMHGDFQIGRHEKNPPGQTMRQGWNLMIGVRSFAASIARFNGSE